MNDDSSRLRTLVRGLAALTLTASVWAATPALAQTTEKPAQEKPSPETPAPEGGPPSSEAQSREAAPAKETPPTPGGLPAAVRRARWVASVSAEQGWQSDAGFTAGQSQSDFDSRLSASIARDWTASRTNASVRASAGGAAYWQLSDLDALFFSLDASGSRRTSRRLTVTARLTGGQDYSQNLVTADAQLNGVLQPVVMRRVLGEAAIQYKMSPIDTMSVQLLGTAYDFDSEQYLSGSSLEFRLDWNRSRGKDGSVSAFARASRGNSEDTNGSTGAMGLGWDQRLAAGWGVQVSAGVAVITPIGSTSTSAAPTGRLGVQHVDRRSRFEFTVGQDSRMSYGFGRMTVARGGNAMLTRTLSERLSGTAHASFEQSDDPAAVDFSLKTTAAGASGRLRLTSSVAATLSYDYYLQKWSSATQAMYDGHVVRLSVAWDRVLR